MTWVETLVYEQVKSRAVVVGLVIERWLSIPNLAIDNYNYNQLY